MITIIGTAHISHDSVTEVREKINEIRPDVVAVELCEPRYRGLTEQKDIPILDLIKDKNSMFVITNVLLSLLQRRLGEEVGIKPGREMLTAIDTAKEQGIDFALIDRDIGITLKRTLSKMGFFEKLRAVKEIFLAFDLSKDDLEVEVEELIQKAQYQVIGLVIHTVDNIMHVMQFGTAGMHQQVELWLTRYRYLTKLVARLMNAGFAVFLTSDHGNGGGCDDIPDASRVHCAT